MNLEEEVGRYIKYIGDEEEPLTLEEYFKLEVLDRVPREKETGFRKTRTMRRIEKEQGKPLEDLLNKAYIIEEKNLKTITEELGLSSEQTVRNWLLAFGIPLRSKSEAHLLRHSKPSLDARDIVQRYNDGETMKDIGKSYETSGKTIRRLLEREGVVIPPRVIKNPGYDTLERLYWDEEKTLREIAEIYDTTDAIVGRWMKKEGVPQRTKEQVMELRQRGKTPQVCIPREKIQPLYEAGVLIQDIAKVLQVTRQTVRRAIRLYGLEREDNSPEHLESMVKGYLGYMEEDGSLLDFETYCKNYGASP